MLITKSEVNPPTITIAKGRCESEPMPCESAAGSNPRVATSIAAHRGNHPDLRPFSCGRARELQWRSGVHELDVNVQVVFSLAIPGEGHLLAIERESGSDLPARITGQGSGPRHRVRCRAKGPQ